MVTDSSELAARLAAVGHALERHRDAAVTALIECETRKTAVREVDKTIRALETYDRELPLLADREPVGAVAVALPYNNPLYSMVLYCGGPLLAGNSVRCRPSSLTAAPLSQICELLSSALSELPLTIEVGASGADFIRYEYLEGRSDAFIFTGSWGNARELSEERVGSKLIYCGPGVNPFVVLDDADVPTAVGLALEARLFNSGQDCLAAERFYVHESRLDEFVDELLRSLKAIKVGHNDDPEVVVGPLVSVQSANYLRDLLGSHHKSRSTVLRGEIDGSTVGPHVVVTDATDPIVLAEKYGPIFVVVPFTSIAEAELLASDAEYRLGATVVGSAEQAAQLTLPHPHIAVNECLIAYEEDDAHVPFGGELRSGFVRDGDRSYGGPILFSVETSRPKSPTPQTEPRRASQ